jgi:uncharacterized membrane protein
MAIPYGGENPLFFEKNYPMNAAQIHVLFNHFPIIGTLIGIGVVAYGLFRQEHKILDTGLVLWIVMAVLSMPAKFSGEGAEELVEPYGVSHDLIEAHEDAAVFAYYALMVLAWISVGILYLRWRRHTKAISLAWGALVLSLVVAFTLYRAGSTGGAIRHPEIHGTAPADPAGNPTNSPQENQGGEHEDNDD